MATSPGTVPGMRCPTICEDGSPCSAWLYPTDKYCRNCGRPNHGFNPSAPVTPTPPLYSSLPGNVGQAMALPPGVQYVYVPQTGPGRGQIHQIHVPPGYPPTQQSSTLGRGQALLAQGVPVQSGGMISHQQHQQSHNAQGPVSLPPSNHPAADQSGHMDKNLRVRMGAGNEEINRARSQLLKQSEAAQRNPDAEPEGSIPRRNSAPEAPTETEQLEEATDQPSSPREGHVDQQDRAPYESPQREYLERQGQGTPGKVQKRPSSEREPTPLVEDSGPQPTQGNKVEAEEGMKRLKLSDEESDGTAEGSSPVSNRDSAALAEKPVVVSKELLPDHETVVPSSSHETHPTSDTEGSEPRENRVQDKKEHTPGSSNNSTHSAGNDKDKTGGGADESVAPGCVNRPLQQHRTDSDEESMDTGGTDTENVSSTKAGNQTEQTPTSDAAPKDPVGQGKNVSKQDISVQVYKKPDKAQEYYNPETRSRSGANKGSSHVSEKLIFITFHAVTSSAFKMHEKSGSKVVIVFGCNQLGGWNNFEREPMELVESFGDGIQRYRTRIGIPANLLIHGRSIEYKYVVVRAHGKKKRLYEHIPKKYRLASEIVNRKLQLPSEVVQNSEEWVQYDGVMHKAAKFEANPLKWFKDKLRGETLKAAQLMLPKWSTFSCGENQAEEFLEQINQVVFCVKSRMTHEGMDLGDLKEILVPYLKPEMERLQHIVDCRQNGNETEQAGVARLVTAVMICHIVVNHELLNSVDQAFAKPLCYALLLRPDLADYHALEIHFTKGNSESDLAITLKTLIQKGLCHYTFCEPMWVLLMPLYHLLRKQNREQIKNYKSSSIWWGTAGIVDTVKIFQNHHKGPKRKEILEYQRCLAPLFEHDHLLPRMLMALATYQKLHKENMTCFTPEAILNNMLYAFNGYISTDDVENLCDKLGIVGELIIKTRSLLTDNTTSDDCLQKEITRVQLQCQIIEDLMTRSLTVIKYPKYYKQFHAMVVIAFDCLQNQIEACSSLRKKLDSSSTSDQLNENAAYVVRIADLTVSWFRQVFPPHPIGIYRSASFADPYELEILSAVSSIYTGEIWFHQILEFLEHRYKSLGSMTKMELYCYNDFSKCHVQIEKFFSDMAFDAVEHLCKGNHDFTRLFDHMSDETAGKIRRILYSVFDKMWPENGDKDKIRNLVFTWPTFSRYLGILYGKSQGLLMPELEQKISVGLSLFTDMVHRLQEGDLDIKTVQFLMENKQNMEAVQKIIDGFASQTEGGVPKSKVLSQVLDWRRAECEHFQDLTQHVGGFVEMCRQIKPVKMDTLEKKLVQRSDVLNLQKICKPLAYDAETARIRSYTPDITYFELDETLKKCIQSYKRYKDNRTFIMLWKKMGDLAHKRPAAGNALELTTVVQDVYNPACKKIHELLKGIKAGHITFREVTEHFGAYKHNYAELKTELLEMAMVTKDSGDRQWVDQRVTQLHHYHTLDQYSKGAKVMLRLKEKFNLTGDFSVLENISAAERQEDLTIGEMTQDLVSAGRALQGIDEEKKQCLKVFLDNKELIDWLRKSLEGPGQVKVLVDLAMITASGQGDIEVKKVKMLHASIIGYAPLIYELQPDADFNQFLDCCKSVWRALDTDPKLPEKLRDIGRHLEWLKKVKESKGSMELNAFAQAEKINSEGIYKIGNVQKNLPKSVDEALELIIPVAEGDPQTYTFAQLNDLQSKLMLVAGKAQEGKEEVDRFVEIFDGVTRLASLYIKLCSAGSILFKNWTCTFHCDPHRKVNADIDFGLSEQVLHGHNTEIINVTQEIHGISQFLEECLTEWIHHIETKRTEFHTLNYFTTEQLVILRKELAAISQRLPCDKQNMVLAMLSSVRADCRITHLRDAITTATQEIRELERAIERGEEAMEEDELSPSEADNSEQMDGKVEEFLSTLQDSNIPLDLAKKALKEYGVDSVQEAMMWCFQRMTEEESASAEGSEAMDEERSEASESTGTDSSEGKALGKETTLEELTSGLLEHLGGGQGSLQAKLKELWDGYLETVSTSVADYLSIEHLGHVLTHLSHQVGRNLDRSFPEFLKTGQPNLIVCPKAEILQTILDLYMRHGGGEKPLPQRHEVLLCSHDTTPEQVELLLRMASNDENNTFYCLADVGCLDYDVAQKAESCFEKYTRKQRDLRLVVLCSKETEDRSHVVTFLEQYHVPYIAHRTQLQDVQQYLQKHFIVNLARTAPMLDPDCCSVRLVKSHRAGVGKTLKVKRLREKLNQMPGHGRAGQASLCVTIPLQKRQVSMSTIIGRLSEFMPDPDRHVSRIYHIDLAHEVQEGVDHLLFNLLILGSIMDKDGTVWQRSKHDLYIVESMPLSHPGVDRQGGVSYEHSVLHLLPSLTCWSPVESLFILQGNTEAMVQRYPNWRKDDNDQLMDDGQFRSESFQRAYQYLGIYQQGGNLQQINAAQVQGNHGDCLKTLIKYCGIKEPSWAELCHFVHFLNVQLHDCELSNFCNPFVEQDLPNFRIFVVKFMINMSRDFATRSLNISEETPGVAQMEVDDDTEGDDLVQYIIKKRWETSPHPYIFFNADPFTEHRHSMTFLGFNVRPTGEIVDPQTNQVLEHNVLAKNLQDALQRNHVQLNENFDQLPRPHKIERICLVVGNDMPHDPDPTYELTTDNVKKILAIHMRFRCQIPVVVMGETGCGKTRLVKFMCDLQKPPGTEVKNLVLMKVHGGTTDEEIITKVNKASQLAAANRREFPRMDTVLFFDEANTTDSIGLIKEILCDRTMQGQPLEEAHGLKFVVACNPYRKHTDEVIKNLEQAGLGYHVQADATKDRLGRIPMRQLVYRVQALPQSLLPLVWDFGQLNQRIEELYIQQMVQRSIGAGELPNVPGMKEVMSSILSASQEFMKQQKDECSFVSLRDVDRVIKVMSWFYRHRGLLFDLMDRKSQQQEPESDDEDEMPQRPHQVLDETTRSLVLALGVCYHACLQKRREYRQHISPKFVPPLALPHGADTIEQEINSCQEVFLDQIKLGDNIARNQALKENLFMMVVCIELRIPLFLVGKPGSSKSLAKTIVTDAMQGDASHKTLFKELKLVHMISFQCSPLSRPDGIVGTFRQCAQLQEEKDLEKFVAVVVLDEVGLAEDSPLMPLKTLHPLLEDGCQGDEEPAPHKKVACIAISNWALDPAKMNRGIHVQRGVPDTQELEDSAKGICSTEKLVQTQITTLFKPLADGYLKLYDMAVKEKREFFGLRDFYSLVKMVYGFSNRSKKKPTWLELKHAILRNFGGLDKIDPVDVFKDTITDINQNAPREDTDPDCSPSAMIEASLHGDGLTSESRYLLILTENYAALGILQQDLLNDDNTTVIFGSSFPKDQEYTQVCRNINKIKVCMEAGRTVVLLNLENLYESLYDALNQYYVKLGGDRFVDLGLGTQRVKCEVHKDFKLVVVAEKQVVYVKFPIPLINRLEKHFLAMTNMLTEQQIKVVEQLEIWARQFADVPPARHPRLRNRGPRIEDVFIGYNVDTAASVIMQVCQKLMGGRRKGDAEWAQNVLERAQDLLLQCATPDAVIRLKDSQQAFYQRYFDHQQHSSLRDLLTQEIRQRDHRDGLFLQVTTHSKLLSNHDASLIMRSLELSKNAVKLAALQAFDTEQQFTKMLREFFGRKEEADRLLLLQCDGGNECGDLIACARYLIQDEYSQACRVGHPIHVVLVVQLPRIGRGSFVGFQGGRWLSYHIDDLHQEKDQLPSLQVLKNKSVSTLIEGSLRIHLTEEPMDVIEEFPRESGDMTESWVKVSKEEDMEGLDDVMSLSSGDEDMEVEQTPKTEPLPLHLGRAQEVPPCAMDAARDFLGMGDTGANVKQSVQNVMQMGRNVLEKKDCKQLDVDRLMARCIHAAAAMIKDYEEDADRKTKRVEILLSLLNQSKERGHQGKTAFIDVVNFRVCKLLKDKEEMAMTTEIANKWLCNEAASVEAVNKAGTFRKALWQYLEAKVTPLLAGLIAYADRNRNMDILMVQPLDTWVHKFWLSMLMHADITELTYGELQTVLHRTELSEFQVETSGCDKQLFSAILPFSWVLYNKIEMLIFQANSQKVQEDVDVIVNRLLNEQALKVMKTFTSETRRGEFVEMYLHDFVRMVYKPQSEDPDIEHELIKKCLRQTHQQRQSLREPITNDDNDEAPPPLELTLPGVHLAYDQIKHRLRLCSQAFQVWPQCIFKLHEPMEKRIKDENQMILDFQILQLMLVELTPDKEKFDKERMYQACRKAWMEKVDKFRPVIERMLTSMQDHIGDSETCQQHRTQLSHIWIKVNVLYLFIQHVCPPDVSVEGRKMHLYQCMGLWNFFRKEDDTDFKREKALSQVETFLKTCNTRASTFYFKKNKTCKRCNNTMNNPTSLPCKHVVCQMCVQEMKALNQRKCPECKKEFPANYRSQNLQGKSEEIEAHNQYKQRCNAFFMDLVSRLCFQGTAPPDKAVITKLLGYVTCENKLVARGTQQTTRNLTLFNDSIDPTPVVRSFLLQLLLRSEVDYIREHLDDYFVRARGVLQQNPQEILELCTLCVHCLEDHHYGKLSQIPRPDGKVLYIRNILQKYTWNLDREELDIEQVETVAGMRFGLTQVAEYMHSMCLLRDKRGTREGRLQELFKVAKITCDQGPRVRDLTPTILYLMRQIHKLFGRDALQQIGDTQGLAWVIPNVARNVEGGAQADRYVVLGDEYKVLRDQLAEVLLGKDPKELMAAFKDQKSPNVQKERNMLLAIHREVTSVLVKPKDQQPTQEVLVSVATLCQQDFKLKHLQLLDNLLKNGLGGACRQLTLTANQRPREAELVELLLHCWIVFETLPRDKLPEPLLALMSKTHAMKDAFLPSMPEDELEEVRNALLARRNAQENPVMYRCPNGHIYFIGNCGRPAVGAHCRDCGALIGGTGYRLHDGNQLLQDTGNRTSPGYVLGRAAQRGNIPVPERLSPSQTCVLRMLVNMAMFLGANRDPRATSRLVRPPNTVTEAEVPNFLWEHLLLDLRVLGTALNKSPEEAAIFMHFLLDRMLTRTQTPGLGQLDAKLSTVESRRNWERKFVEEYVAPVQKNIDQSIVTANNMLVNDSRLANNPLMKALYEVEQPNKNPNVNEILNEPVMWRGRARITMEHLNQQFQESRAPAGKGKGKRAKAKHDVLHLFLQEVHQSQVLRFLPGIIKLQRFLSQKFHRNIDSAEATKLCIQDLKQEHVEEHLRDEYTELIQGFAEAWEFLKAKLGTFAVGGSSVPAEYCECSVTDDTSLAMLLPSTRGQGLCAMALVHYMVQIHNNIVEEFARITKQLLSTDRVVSVQEVTQAHLVSYHPDRDLMPIVLANCNYSLVKGQTTTVEYDYGGMEQQLVERFIRGRTRIRPEVYPITFREDFTNNAVFNQLKSKIPQDPVLSGNLQQHVRRQLRHLTELNDSLATLDIAIGFLVSVGGEREMPLMDFIENKLKMAAGALKGAAQGCHLKHTQALWLLLSHERAKHLASGDQEVFESLDDKYKEEVPEDLVELLTVCFQHLNNPEQLHGYLFEYIVLKLTVQQDTNDEDYIDNKDQPMHYVLAEYLEEREYKEVPALSNSHFPMTIKLRHSAATWRLALKVLRGH